MAKTSDKVIYGRDNRVEAADYNDPLFVELSKSVAGRVSSYRLQASQDSAFEVDFLKISLGNRMNMCRGQRFSEQNTLPDCSGFLVGKDILVTAGHCMDSKYDCSHYKWVFGFENDTEFLTKDQIYSCKSILSQRASYNFLGYAKDYAVIQLDREVVDRKPLEFRTKGKIKRGTEVVLIGHPSGLPLKTSDDAKVSKTWGLTFMTNLDAFGGNSGSPVFNKKTGLVEGILIQGAQDYKRIGSCYVANQEKGKKEKVFKITKIKKLKELQKEGKL